MDIGEQIKQLRKRKGWSQKDLGDQVGVLQTHVSKWENGMNPSTENLPRIARALGVPVSGLVGGCGRGGLGDRLSGPKFRAICDLVDIIDELPPGTAERIAEVLLRLSENKRS